MDQHNGLVERVTAERWQEAQRWELSVWQRESRRSRRGIFRSVLARSGLARVLPVPRSLAGDDWNDWWAERFDDYSVLPDRIDNALELGCGPYTNIRLIERDRSIGHIHCSDPLIRDYVALRGSWVAEAHRKAHILIDDHPAEDCPYDDDYFDLTVMINVLDHVRDARACLASCVRVTRPGGFMVVGQDLSDEGDALVTGDDTGHPIRIGHEILDEQLLPHVTPALRKVLGREEGRNPVAHYGTYLLIGVKRTP